MLDQVTTAESSGFGLFMSKYGCPDDDKEQTSWETGYINLNTQITPSRWSPYSHLFGLINSSFIQLQFCIKERVLTPVSSWPQGNYCIFKIGNGCPQGMLFLFITYVHVVCQ